MEAIMATINGRKQRVDVERIRRLLAENPSWNRTRLSRELCERWDWRGANGSFKDMACRDLLLRLERSGLIALPARQRCSTNALRNRSPGEAPHRTDTIRGPLSSLLPLRIAPVGAGGAEAQLFRCLLSRYHYLGLRNTAGANIKYLICSRDGRPLGCFLFASAAWKCAARDAFIGWDAPTRERNLLLLANNTRFLILPWVEVPHLASHALSLASRRVSADWEAKYGSPILLLETFVDRARFRGTCYQAANWRLVGQTKGRTRADRDHTIQAPIKDIYVYPLTKHFRGRLTQCRLTQ
jgi:hypothetical protein